MAPGEALVGITARLNPQFTYIISHDIPSSYLKRWGRVMVCWTSGWSRKTVYRTESAPCGMEPPR